jgi:hypothetical protein
MTSVASHRDVCPVCATDGHEGLPLYTPCPIYGAGHQCGVLFEIPADKRHVVFSPVVVSAGGVAEAHVLFVRRQLPTIEWDTGVVPACCLPMMSPSGRFDVGLGGDLGYPAAPVPNAAVRTVPVSLLLRCSW